MKYKQIISEKIPWTIEEIELKFPWLKKAKFENAIIEIKNNKVIWHNGHWIDGRFGDEYNSYGEGIHESRAIWKDGIWENGTWVRGYWHNGIWKNGEWRGGIWHNGVWKNGRFWGNFWENGVWENGDFRTGVWKDGIHKNGDFTGVWKGGVWEGGRWNLHKGSGNWQGGIWKSKATHPLEESKTINYIQIIQSLNESLGFEKLSFSILNGLQPGDKVELMMGSILGKQSGIYKVIKENNKIYFIRNKEKYDGNILAEQGRLFKLIGK